MAPYRRPAVPTTAVAASPTAEDNSALKSRFSDHSLSEKLSKLAALQRQGRSQESTPVINITHNNDKENDNSLADELDYITVGPEVPSSPLPPRADKASRILGVRHRRSMEPIPASARNSIVSTHSARDNISTAPFTPSLPLTSLYVVSGLPKSPHTWTLADPDSVLGLHHIEGGVSRWWRPEVLGSTVSPGAGGGKKKRRGKVVDDLSSAGALSKTDVGKMLSKALKLSFTREVEVIASTLQPASTIHTFTFTLPAPNTPLGPTPSGDLLRASIMSSTDNRSSAATFSYPYSDDPFARPSSSYLGPPSLIGHNSGNNGSSLPELPHSSSSTVTYHGVCLTVWSHADAERTTAIRRTLEAGRSRKESAQSVVTARLKNLRGDSSSDPDPTVQARRSARKSARGPWGDIDTDGGETEGEGALSESDFEVASTVGHGPGESTLFLPGDTVFWLPYALTLVSRHPVYDLMRDYLTLSWARFSKDVQSHTLQISKILAHPAPRAGDIVRLDASPKNTSEDSTLEVVARFPGGLDFGRGLVDINFTMWPLFKCLNIDNILTICEIALAPTGRILLFSRHPAMLGIAVNTIKYLVELRGWNGIALPAVHSRDAKIYIDDPGPWILGLATEARYSIRPSPEVCVVDLDINYLSCPSPPPGAVSTKQLREKYRQRLLTAFDAHYHPDHAVPSEFKEAFPAGRFRPICKIQAKRGASSSAVAEQVKPPDWWHSTRIIQAFDSVLQDKYKKPSFLKRISMFGAVKRAPQLTAAEQLIQLSIRKRATAFVDARDDLETKIGRLSRRLNFLMTESDLWRDKFVTFEQYAEKLSAEANQLRAKINKEQRETKRLSGLVTLTAAEKMKLQNQLKDTESAHKDAVVELDQMKQAMEKMEEERAEMVAEIEAQIERALESMAVGIDESDYGGSSRPSSRMSSVSGHPRSRRGSDAGRALRSFGTESTLAEVYTVDGEVDGLASWKKSERETTTIEEDDEDEAAVSPAKKKRFSASNVDMPQDNMNAVDQGISEKSDNIAKKVLEIQQKLETALSSDRDRRTMKWKNQVSSNTESEEDFSDNTVARPRPRLTSKSTLRKRSGTTSSTQTNNSVTSRPSRSDVSGDFKGSDVDMSTPTRRSLSEVGKEEPSNKRSTLMPSIQSRAPITGLRTIAPIDPPTVPVGASGTEDSDTDFQSAYSTSPRGSYYSEEHEVEASVEKLGDIPDEFGTHNNPVFSKPRHDRISTMSNSTAVNVEYISHPSPTLTDTTMVSPAPSFS